MASLVDRVCKRCGAAFAAKASLLKHGQYKGLYCSRACGFAARAAERVERVCQVCGVTFVRRARQIDRPGRSGNYCSPVCWNASPENQAMRLRPRSQQGRANIKAGVAIRRPRPILPPLIKVCKQCLAEYEVPRDKARAVRAKRAYCSPECHYEHLRLHPELSGRWRGGTSFLPYPIIWTPSLRRRIKLRDGWRCQICYSRYRLHVHHIDWDKANCQPVNLTSLCPTCHMRVHTNVLRFVWAFVLTQRVRSRVRGLLPPPSH